MLSTQWEIVHQWMTSPSKERYAYHILWAAPISSAFIVRVRSNILLFAILVTEPGAQWANIENWDSISHMPVFCCSLSDFSVLCTEMYRRNQVCSLVFCVIANQSTRLPISWSLRLRRCVVNLLADIYLFRLFFSFGYTIVWSKLLLRVVIHCFAFVITRADTDVPEALVVRIRTVREKVPIDFPPFNSACADRKLCVLVSIDWRAWRRQRIINPWLTVELGSGVRESQIHRLERSAINGMFAHELLVFVWLCVGVRHRL